MMLSNPEFASSLRVVLNASLSLEARLARMTAANSGLHGRPLLRRFCAGERHMVLTRPAGWWLPVSRSVTCGGSPGFGRLCSWFSWRSVSIIAGALVAFAGTL